MESSSFRGGRSVHFSPRRTGPNMGLRARRPVLYDELRHRKIFGIPGCEPRTDADRRSRDKAIRLAQGDPFGGVVAPPLSRTLALLETEGRYPQPSEEPA